MLGTAKHALSGALNSSRQFSSSTRNAAKVVYTYTDEAPALATAAFLPVVNKFTKVANLAFEISDISVAARVLALWPDRLTPDQRKPDNLAALGELAKQPDANIIKLPNVSASVPQLAACIAELQGKGYDIPSYPQAPKTAEEKEIKDTYAKVLGSAVNPVLREGNSDRRAAAPVKAYAQAHPKKMGAWSKDSKTHVAFMKEGDFYGSEKSYVMPKAGNVRIELLNKDGEVKVLKAKTSLLDNEIIDAAFMSRAKLAAFVETELADAKTNDVLLSLHLKATMMKVSDPRMFGTVVSVFFKDVFSKHADLFTNLGVNPNNGFGDVLEKIKNAPDAVRSEVLRDIDACYASRPAVAMVNSDKGITNLHVPSDVIVDASMPVVIRDSGKMYNAAGDLQDTKCMIPDRCYARVFQTAVDFVKQNGQFDAATMGHTSNVGLMAQKAEEYGSHDKTFEIPYTGTVRVVNENDNSTVFEHKVEEGDIWRMCQTKDVPVKDWVKLAVNRARASNTPAIFWLDSSRAHDANIIKSVERYLSEHDIKGLDISIKTPQEACWISMERAKAGKDTISVTGNVLRDYNTDLFPILELASSSKMLSIVPLLAGGGLYETGAGGSAPKHVQQFVEEGHLRWDSLGEYLATAVSLEELGNKTGNLTTTLLGATLNEAVAEWLNNNKSPSRKVNQIDNRGSTFYLAMYWAAAMAKHDNSFSSLASSLKENEEQITQDLIACQGKPVDIGGYYLPSVELTAKAMRPSATFNAIIDA
eukprot:CFRG2659T1